MCISMICYDTVGYGMVWSVMIRCDLWRVLVWSGMICYDTVGCVLVWSVMIRWVWHGMICYNTVWYGTVWFDKILCDVVQNNLLWYSVMCISMIYYNTVWCGTVWYVIIDIFIWIEVCSNAYMMNVWYGMLLYSTA